MKKIFEFINAFMSPQCYQNILNISVSSGNGAIENLSKKDLDNVQLLTLNNPEPLKIDKIFNNLDNLITLHQCKGEKLKNLKKIITAKDFYLRRKNHMAKIVLFRGTHNEKVVPIYGYGNDKHDYGRGFYLTESSELAKEWAVCKPDETNGWVHKYELDTDGLKTLDFQEESVLAWLAELMKHRDAADSKRYRVLAEKFINKYGIDTSEYDVIKGWRADASYFYIAKEFVKDNIDLDILEELLSLGGLGIQYCLKSDLAFSKLKEVENELLIVNYAEFNEKYNQRDSNARQKMRELVNSEANKVTKVFSILIKE